MKMSCFMLQIRPFPNFGALSCLKRNEKMFHRALVGVSRYNKLNLLSVRVSLFCR